MLTNPAVGPDVSPEAVLRTLSGLQVVQGGCESVAPVSAAPPGRHAGTLPGPQKRKKPIRKDGLFTCLMPGSLWRASCPPPSGPLLRNVQIRSRRICPAPESAHRQTTDKTKGPVFRLSLSFYLMPGSSLLSHGETPHYHRRYGVSLLSSAWGQVGPPRYRRQANSLCSSCVFCAHTALAALASVSHILMYAPSIASFAALSQRKILRTLNQS